MQYCATNLQHTIGTGINKLLSAMNQSSFNMNPDNENLFSHVIIIKY